MKTSFFVLSVVCFLAAGCIFQSPAATMTNKYIKVTNPGQYWFFSEIRPERFDSTFGYPVTYKTLASYSWVNEESKKKVTKSNQIHFDKKYKNRVWQIQYDPYLAKYEYVNIIKIRPDSWYSLTTENYGFHVYIYIDSQLNCKRIEEPKKGSW